VEAIKEITQDTIKKHRMEEQYPRTTHIGPYILIQTMAERVLTFLRTGENLVDMHQALAMIQDMPEYAQYYKNDHTVKLAVESVVINALWRFVEVEGSVDSPAALLEKWSNFEKERSHWWRARKAAETDENIQNKWENLLVDIMPLLNFHNAMLHSQRMLEKPTLKHTLHLAAMTAEGRIYENGQGRSIASECRHILVRTQCDIPIKSRPERKSSDSQAGALKKPKAYKEARPKPEHKMPSYDNAFSYDATSFTNHIGVKRTRGQLSSLGGAYYHEADPVTSTSRIEDAHALLGLGRNNYSPSDRVEAILASQRGSAEASCASSGFRPPVAVQRQSSAEEWGQTLGFIGRDRSSDQKVPEFNHDMLTSIRRYADGSSREAQFDCGRFGPPAASSPYDYMWAGQSPRSPVVTEAPGALSRQASFGSTDPSLLSRQSTLDSLGAGLAPLKMRRQGSAEWPHHLNESGDPPVFEGHDNVFETVERAGAASQRVESKFR